MAKINLLELEESNIVASLRGQKILIYGGNNLGKTNQSMKMEKPLLLMTEPGGNGTKGYKVNISKWSVFKDVVGQLTSEKVAKDDVEDEAEAEAEVEAESDTPKKKKKKDKADKRPQYEVMQDKFQTIIIDTLENLVDFCEQAVCQEFGVRDLSEINGKQNGYAIFRKDFKAQINKLCSYGYTVVFISHEEIVELTDEITGEKYTFVQPKGTSNVKASTRFVRDLCDCCFYVKANGVDENGDTIPSTALCKQTRHVFARSRYAIQTYINPFTAENMTAAILKAIEKSAEDEGAVLSDWQMDRSEYTAADWVDLIRPYYKAIFLKYPDKVKEIVALELGEGKKLSTATDNERTELENIYNQLVTFACDQGIVVEI